MSEDGLVTVADGSKRGGITTTVGMVFKGKCSVGCGKLGAGGAWMQSKTSVVEGKGYSHCKAGGLEWRCFVVGGFEMAMTECSI